MATNSVSISSQVSVLLEHMVRSMLLSALVVLGHSHWRAWWFWTDQAVCSHHLILYGLSTKDGLHILKWLKEIKKKTFHDRWRLCKAQISVFIKFYWTRPRPFVYKLPVAAVTLQWWSWVVATETESPQKPEIFTVWLFIENVCWLLIWESRSK